MLEGYDPHEIAAGNVVVNDCGEGPDLSKNERILTSAVMSRDIVGCPTNPQTSDRHTQLSVASLLPWLRRHGYDDLAAGLETPEQGQANFSAEVPDPQRRLDRLRKMGGSATYRRQGGAWKFKGISALVNAEAVDAKPRSSEKTIRSDLVAAADAERLTKAEGSSPSPFPTVR